MTITLDLPEEVLRFLASYGPTPERGAIAAIAVHLYREGRLSTADLSGVLGFDAPELHAFLKEHGVPLREQPADPASNPQEDR
jgi:hypothetical protein